MFARASVENKAYTFAEVSINKDGVALVSALLADAR